MVYMVHLSSAHDDGNAAAMSTPHELGVAQLGACDTEKMAWGEQLETAHRVRVLGMRVLGKRRELVQPPAPRVPQTVRTSPRQRLLRKAHGS
jgi:hypothetical protein